ncbi:hypothetical protein [Nocardia nova]|uniref:hypothetical protein n=1 Tax=Nocardia nova TaxID=37330 RepID=UPI001CA5731A|nr:hypothetical protein [Nocardia nova]
MASARPPQQRFEDLERSLSPAGLITGVRGAHRRSDDENRNGGGEEQHREGYDDHPDR